MLEWKSVPFEKFNLQIVENICSNNRIFETISTFIILSFLICCWFLNRLASSHKLDWYIVNSIKTLDCQMPSWCWRLNTTTNSCLNRFMFNFLNCNSFSSSMFWISWRAYFGDWKLLPGSSCQAWAPNDLRLERER